MTRLGDSRPFASTWITIQIANKKGDLVLFVVSSIVGKLTSLPLGIYEPEQGVSLERLGVFNVDSLRALTYPLKSHLLRYPSSNSPNQQAGVCLDDS